MSLIKNLIKAVLPSRLILYKGRSRARRVCLTFDDGPHQFNTPKILDILKKYNVKATFFLQGHLIEPNKDIVVKMAVDGHQLANHGYQHKSCDELSFKGYMQNVFLTEQALRQSTSSKTQKLYRPPYGSLSVRSFLSLITRGYKFIMWSVDSRDSFLSTSSDIVSYIKSIDIRAGDILLFHDDYGRTVESLSKIIEYLQSENFSMVTIETLVND